MNIFHILCMVLMIAMMQHTCIAEITLDNTKEWDAENQTITIFNESSKTKLMTVKLISARPDLCTFTEIYEVWNFEAYTPDSKADFKARTNTVVGSGAVTNIEWFIEQNVSYIVNVTDYDIKQIEKEVYNNKTGKNETILVNEMVIIGYHDETRYNNIWFDYQPYVKEMKKDQIQKIKIVYYKVPELGPFQILTVPMFRGIECPELTWWSGSWDRRRQLVIDYNMVAAVMTNFPVMISINQTGLNDNGNDTRFTDSSGNQVAREVECYNATSGELVVFFNGTSISNITNTTFWMYYGNAAAIEPAVDSIYGSQAVWDSDFKAVWHLNQEPNGAGASTILDSTLNEKHATQHNFVANSLEDADYGKGIHFDDVNDYISFPQLYTSLSEVTTTVKFKSDVADTTEQRLYVYGGDGSYVITSINSGTANLIKSLVSTWSSATSSYSVMDWRIISTQAEDGVSLYTFVDGNRIGANVVPTFVSSGSDRLIGVGDNSPITQRADGIMSEVRVSTIKRSDNWLLTEANNLKNPTSIGVSPFFILFGAEEEYVAPTPTPTPVATTSISPVQYDELDLPLILYILTISMLYLFIAFRNGVATIELSLIYLIFAFIFLLFQTVTMSVNYIYLTLFLLLFMISIAGITLKQGAD